jgi:hypothetical protein
VRITPHVAPRRFKSAARSAILPAVFREVSSCDMGGRGYFFAFFALAFVHRALAAAEIFALAAALILRLFLFGAGAPAFEVEGYSPMIRLSSFSRVSIFSRILTACFNCWRDTLARRLDCIRIQ